MIFSGVLLHCYIMIKYPFPGIPAAVRQISSLIFIFDKYPVLSAIDTYTKEHNVEKVGDIQQVRIIRRFGK